MKNKMSLSVIIPMYNSSSTIVQTIHILKTHTQFLNTQIILIDDGSKDNTIECVHPFLDDNVILLNSIHKGVSHARNIGIMNATGEYLMFLDSDDVIQTNISIDDSDLDIISFSSKVQEKNNKIVVKDDKLLLIDSMFGFSNLKYVSDEFFGGPVSKLYRTKFIKDQQIWFDENLANSEDLLFNINAIMSAKTIMLINLDLYKYVNNLDSVTHSLDIKLFNNHIYFMKSLMNGKLENEKQFINKISLLYLYQLLFRYFIYWPDIKQYKDYLITTKLRRRDLKPRSLMRISEKLSIFMLKLFGFRLTVYIIKVLKKIIQK